LAEAVRIRLIADVPLGALLSGGTDSSTVVALMARASSKPVKTFSIGFRSEDFNELNYARLVAKRFGTDHHELIVEPDFARTLETLTRSLEEPFADSSMLPTYYVSHLARQHVTVALSGDGGDELFGGYERYQINLQRRKFDAIPELAGRGYRRLIDPLVPHAMYGRRLAYNLSLPWPDRYIDGLSYLPMFGRERSLFARDFLESAASAEDPIGLYRQYVAQAPAHDSLSQLMYLDTKTYLPGDILTKVDRMSMATSLEVRVPILDHLLAEWVTGLPAGWKLRDGQPKYILRKLAERVGVPPEVLHRPKQGFALPLVHWMRKELKDELPRLLLEPRSLQRGYFEPRAVKRLLQEHFRGRRDHGQQIWLLLVLELWHRNYLEARSDFPTATAAPATLIQGAETKERGAVPVPNTSAASGETAR